MNTHLLSYSARTIFFVFFLPDYGNIFLLDYSNIRSLNVTCSIFMYQKSLNTVFPLPSGEAKINRNKRNSIFLKAKTKNHDRDVFSASL